MQTPPADHGPGPFPARSTKGLMSSRWAKATTPTPPYAPRSHHASSTAINPAVPVPPPPPGADAPGAVRHSYELQRFEKIAKRLSWKLYHLSAGFHRAAAADPAERAHSEIMFKLDFYEFYMLLERALVHLLGVFDISVSRDAAASANGGFRGPAAGGARSSDHAYHHNVLAALDSPDNVLHGVLGRGDVRTCLGKAKEMRNKWKYLDEEQVEGGEMGLAECNVEAILETIVGAFEVAYEVARDKVESETCGEPEQQVDWGFMVDAMDWEAL